MSGPWKKVKLNTLAWRGRSLLLPIVPLSVATMVSLFQGKPLKLIITFSACLCFAYAGQLTHAYFSSLVNMLKEENPVEYPEDERHIAMLLTAIAIGMLSAYLFRRPIMILLHVLFAAGAYYFHYYNKQLPEDIRQSIPTPIVSSHLPPALAELIESGKENVSQLQSLAKTYQHVDYNGLCIVEKISTMAQHAHKIIASVANDPDNIRRLRSFFVVQLPEITQICTDCLKSDVDADRLEELDQLLDQVTANFIEQNVAINNADELLLDIKMDVLREQIASKQYDKRN